MVRIITWNIGGAKCLEFPEKERKTIKKTLTDSLCRLTQEHSPDFVVLQEII